MADSCDIFLKGLEQGLILTAEGIEEWEQTDNDEILDKLLGAGIATSSAGYAAARLREDVIKDRDLLHSFAERAGKVTRAGAPKLTVIV